MLRTVNVSHITYRAWDVEQSFEFFVETFGFSSRRRGHTTYVCIGETLVEIGLATDEERSRPQDPNRYVFGVAVENLDEAIVELTAGGVVVVKPIWRGNSFWGRQAVISPPGGPHIALREWEAPDGPNFGDWSPRNTVVT